MAGDRDALKGKRARGDLFAVVDNMVYSGDSAVAARDRTSGLFLKGDIAGGVVAVMVR
jgi:hypothetical protein